MPLAILMVVRGIFVLYSTETSRKDADALPAISLLDTELGICGRAVGGQAPGTEIAHR